MINSVKRQKIFFALAENEWHNHVSESLWAIKLDNHIYKVDNIPTFVYGISLADKIKCVTKGNSQDLWFDTVLERSGNSTYRILIANKEQENQFNLYWKDFKDLGCSFESTSTTPKTVAINVPATSEIYAVYNLLEKGESNGLWTFEEGFCGHSTNN